jgi:hypothetical protein
MNKLYIILICLFFNSYYVMAAQFGDDDASVAQEEEPSDSDNDDATGEEPDQETQDTGDQGTEDQFGDQGTGGGIFGDDDTSTADDASAPETDENGVDQDDPSFSQDETEANNEPSNEPGDSDGGDNAPPPSEDTSDDTSGDTSDDTSGDTNNETSGEATADTSEESASSSDSSDAGDTALSSDSGDTTVSPEEETQPQPSSAAVPASSPVVAPQLSEEKNQQKLKGMDYIRQLQNALLEGNKETLCGESGLCLKNFGEGCKTSKNFLSVCAAVCSDINEFRGSYCVNAGAKRYKMNAQSLIYDARPKKQKKAESVVQHIVAQLREGRKALRDDKRLFFNTLCTPPAIQMLPEHDRGLLGRACLDFLYNGYPPVAVLKKFLQDNNLEAPLSPQIQGTAVAAAVLHKVPQTAAGPDDVQAPMGGLTTPQSDDLGANYTGTQPPIVEDKESFKSSSKKGKHKKHKKKKSKKKAHSKKKARAVKSQESEEADQDDSSQDDSSQEEQAPVTPPPPAPPQPSPSNPSAAPVTGTTPPPPDNQESQQQNQKPGQNKKQDEVLGVIGGLVNKLANKKGNQQNAGNDQATGGDTGDNTDTSGQGNNKNKIQSTLGKFLKF